MFAKCFVIVENQYFIFEFPFAVIAFSRKYCFMLDMRLQTSTQGNMTSSISAIAFPLWVKACKITWDQKKKKKTVLALNWISLN